MKYHEVSQLLTDKYKLKVTTLVLGPLCYKLITVVTYYVKTGLSCIVY